MKRLFCQISETLGYQTLKINLDTTVQETLRMALEKFKIGAENIDKYNLVEVSIDQDMSERILGLDERPVQIIQKSRKVGEQLAIEMSVNEINVRLV